MSRAILSRDWGRRVERLTALWPELSDLVVSRFDELWHSNYATNGQREKTLFRGFHSNAYPTVPPPPYLWWLDENLELAFHEVMNGFHAVLWRKGVWGPESVANVVHSTCPPVRLPAAIEASRYVRPRLAPPHHAKQGVSGIPTANVGASSHEGWIRCAHYERQLLVPEVGRDDPVKRKVCMSGAVRASDADEFKYDTIFANISPEDHWGISIDEESGVNWSLDGPFIGAGWVRGLVAMELVLALHPDLVAKCGLSPSRWPGCLQFCDDSGNPAVVLQYWRSEPASVNLAANLFTLEGCELLVHPVTWARIQETLRTDLVLCTFVVDVSSVAQD